MLRVITTVLVLASLSAGCQHNVVRKKVNELVSTTPDLYYEQVLDNLAMMAASPQSMPYFAVPQSGSNTNQRQLQASYTPGWDFISGASALFGRYLFDKQSAQIGGSFQNSQAFQLQPMTDPDKLLLMQYAYRKAVGNPLKLRELYALRQYFANHQSQAADYYFAITGDHLRVDNEGNMFVTPQGSTTEVAVTQPDASQGETLEAKTSTAEWLGITHCSKDVPKHNCYIGEHCDVSVWPIGGQSEESTLFTLAILDIATAAPKAGPTKIEIQPLIVAQKDDTWTIGPTPKQHGTSKTEAVIRPFLQPRLNFVPYPAAPQ